jgi:hypothetical protein
VVAPFRDPVAHAPEADRRHVQPRRTQLRPAHRDSFRQRSTREPTVPFP